MSEFKANLTIRGDIIRILLLCVAAIAILYYLPQLPDTYTYMFKTPGGRKPIRIPLILLKEYSLYVASLIGLIAGYIALYARLTLLEGNRINLSITSGILSKTTDSLDFTKVNDFRKKRNLLDMILGISKVYIVSRDPSHPKLWIRGLKKKDADSLYQHLMIYSSQNYGEYRRSRQEETRLSRKSDSGDRE